MPVPGWPGSRWPIAFARQVSFSSEGDVFLARVNFFDEEIELTIPEFAFKSVRGSNITLSAKIVLLHCLITASGEPLGSDLVPYEDIPGCRSYAPVFDRRVTKPLLSAFGFARDAFFEAGVSLGGQKKNTAMPLSR